MAGGAPLGAREEREEEGRARVLVVDDSDAVRRLIRINLELEGFDVVEAGDGAECLALLPGAGADVVTLDLLLPGGPDGLDVLRRIRADPDLDATRVLVVTAAARGEDERRASSAGADAYIAKPFEPEELIATVRRLAEARGEGDPRRRGRAEAGRGRTERWPHTRPATLDR